MTRMMFRSPLAALFLIALLAAADRAGAQAVQDPASIGAAAEDFVRREIPAGVRRGALVRVANLDDRLRLARCETPLRVNWSPGAAPTARTSVVVACAGAANWRLHVPVSIRSRIDVLVLKAPAARGRSLVPADVTPRTIEVAGLAHLYIRTPQEFVGRHLSRPAPAGVPLSTNWFVADKIVKRGQAVTLVALADGIRIRAPGRAMSDAAAQERVRVQNLSSLKVVEGVVENGTEVRVTP